MTPLTNQQIIDRVRHYFSQTGAKLGYDVDTASCVYQGADGEKCAVGCLLPPGVYDPGFEGSSVDGIFDHISALFEERQGALYILGRLQSAHDSSTDALDPVGSFLKKMDTLEVDFRSEGYLPYPQ